MKEHPSDIGGIYLMEDELSEDVDYEPSFSVQPKHGFHFLSVSELYSRPKPTWLIKPYLDVGTLAVLFGEPGSFKSFVAIDQGLCIASGSNWHGCPVRQGTVFYIVGEGSSGIGCRIRAWEMAHGIDLKKTPFFVSDRAARLLESMSAVEVSAAVEKLRRLHGEPALIIVDTLSRNFGPGDESTAYDMGRFVSAIDEHLRIRYRCTVQIIHHPGLAAKDRVRGSSVLTAATDWEYRLSKEAGGKVLLTCTKTKDHNPPPPITFLREIITLDGWAEEDGDLMTSCIMVDTETVGQGKMYKPLTGARKVAFDTLRAVIKESGKESVHIDVWRERAYALGISTSTERDTKKRVFNRAVSDLCEWGWIDTLNDFWWPVRDTGQGRDNTGTCPGTK